MSLWYDVHGEGPAVALVHAGVADSRMWEPQLRSFPASHKVVRVDLPGFGPSPLESSPVNFRSAVREALDSSGVSRAALVGVSLGGNTALERGDLEGAVKANLSTWLAGPRRSLDVIDLEVQERVAGRHVPPSPTRPICRTSSALRSSTASFSASSPSMASEALWLRATNSSQRTARTA